MGNKLYAWVNGEVVGVFTNLGEGRISLEYAPGVVKPLSVSLPIGKDLGYDLPGRWLTNLLPDNKAVLNAIAKDRGIPKRKFALLEALGEDMAGAVSLLPEGVIPGSRGYQDLRYVSENFINDQISKIRAGDHNNVLPFGRMSLAGAQQKFSLGNVEGSWYVSTVAFPSTHIFKPGHRSFPQVESLETATLDLANRVGVKAARSGVYRSGSSTSYVTERFDRVLTPRGLFRIHMEDLNQVAGHTTSDKYSTGLPGIFSALRGANTDEEELYTLVSQMIFNVHVGNADAHAKNYSIFLNGPDGDSPAPTVTPLYDSIPMGVYNVDQNLAMSINGKKTSPEVGVYDWQAWANRLDLDGNRVVFMVEEIVHKIRQFVKDVFDFYELPGVFAESVLESSVRIP